MDIQLGFSTGVFYKEPIALVERIKIIRETGCTALELGLVKMHSFIADDVDALTPEAFKGFKHVSLHAPKFDYGDNPETQKIFDRIRWINSLCKLDWVVVHPDTVLDFSVFQNPGFNVAFENMDKRKKSHKMPLDLTKIFDNNPQFGFVLDINHIFSNDPSMKLASDFHGTLGNRVTEIHLSGYEGYHDPLHETRQPEIIEAVRQYKVPVIIESVLSREGLLREWDYIFQTLSKY